ncbi:carboxymuconolactone decarboxylase family protein [Pseudomonadota bacterium AL_CKDN230030165-1A_HGKHYDSX7]
MLASFLMAAGMTAASAESAAPKAAGKGPAGGATVASADNEGRLSAAQLAITPIGALAASGDIAGLERALAHGLDAGLTVSQTREILVQVYAYAGFPRSLNALNTLMTVLEARKQRGIVDPEGVAPTALPTNADLTAMGTDTQTKLVGAPVKGPLFEFAPAIDHYLKAHLFGAIFARDNLDWRSRELATVGMLSGLTGVESQLSSHIRISLNTGLTAAQLGQLPGALQAQGAAQAAERLEAALAKDAR